MGKQYLRYTWISQKLKTGKSKIHGEGVFASEKISVGEKLMEFGGEVVSREKAFSGNYRSRSIWPVERDLYLALPNTDTHESLDESLNHSCDANSWLGSEVILVARRDIEPGEEITLDQGTWNFEDDDYTDDKTPCSCGAADCRKKLTKDDWKTATVQGKYKGHFHPLIQKMIDANSV